MINLKLTDLNNKINSFRKCLIEKLGITDLHEFFSEYRNGLHYLNIKKPINKYNLGDLISFIVLSDVSNLPNDSNSVKNYFVFIDHPTEFGVNNNVLHELTEYLESIGIKSFSGRSRDTMRTANRVYFGYIYILMKNLIK